MELTRRDALAVLAGMGLVGGGGAAVTVRRAGDGDREESPRVREALPTLVATAEVLYPGETTGVREFVETYVDGKRGRNGYSAGVTEAVTAVDEAAREWYDAPYAELDRATRDSVLRELGVEAAHPDPEGSRAERVRFFVVNDLLYAFYTSPTGAELVGASNPVGYPGGTEAYQRKP